MKKVVYILLFTFLGILVSLLVHSVVEIPVIYLLINNFDTYGLGLTWAQWFMVHNTWTVLTFVLGIYFGYRKGKHWWGRLYGKGLAKKTTL